MEQPAYTGAICKGDFDLGSHCGACEKCQRYGWVKEKPVKPLKRKALTAPEIVEDKLYMLSHPRIDHGVLVKIICTPNAGWLRGHVKIDNFHTVAMKFSAHAYGIIQDGGSKGATHAIQVTRNREDEPWTFQDLGGFRIFHEAPDGYLDSEIRKIDLELDVLIQRKANLLALKK